MKFKYRQHSWLTNRMKAQIWSRSSIEEFITVLGTKWSQYHSENADQWCELNETKKGKEEDQKTNAVTVVSQSSLMHTSSNSLCLCVLVEIYSTDNFHSCKVCLACIFIFNLSCNIHSKLDILTPIKGFPTLLC